MGKRHSTKCPGCWEQGSEKEAHPSDRYASGKKGVYICNTADCRVDFYLGDSISEKEGW